MKKVMIAILVLSSIIVGCSKEETVIANPPTTTVQNNGVPEKHIPLAIGNYWIYETIRIDTLGNETVLSGIDSAYIDRDTIVDGNIYFIISGGTTINHIMGRMVRNFDGKVINLNSQNEEKILFSTYNLGAVYRTDSIYSGPLKFYSTTKTNTQFVPKNTLAGTFSTFEGVSSINQVVPLNPNWNKTEKRYYDKSVGVVCGQYVYYSSPNIFELRLMRYHLN